MKIIFFLGTVDIFWVMESWVMKKLLGPNGRAKTEFSLYIFPNNFDALWGKRIYLFIYFYGIELQATVILSRYQYYSTPIRALAGVAESSTMAITFASSSVMLPSPSPKPSFGSLKKTTPFLGFSISAANPKPSFPRQSFRVNCQDKAAVVPLDQRWMFEQSEVSGPVRFSLSLSLSIVFPPLGGSVLLMRKRGKWGGVQGFWLWEFLLLGSEEAKIITWVIILCVLSVLSLVAEKMWEKRRALMFSVFIVLLII